MRYSKIWAKPAALAAFVVLSTIGAAASAPGSDVAQARRGWAERHVTLVCRPLEERGLVRQARRCFQEAVRARASSLSDATGSTRAIPERIDAPLARQRCAGIACLRMFSSLGIGF